MTDVSVSDGSLRALREQPFELLCELERRLQAVTEPRAAAEDSEWLGIGFRIGADRFLVARQELQEVISWPAGVARVPGAKPWLRGITSVHGQLFPMIDLRQYLGSGLTTPQRQSRVIIANHKDIPAGFLVDEVSGFVRCAPSAYEVNPPSPLLRCDRYLVGGFRHDDSVWPVLSLTRLIEAPAFLQAAC
jgi:twitching motility protein PilI